MSKRVGLRHISGGAAKRAEQIESVKLLITFRVNSGFLFTTLKICPDFSNPAGPSWVVVDTDFPPIADKNKWLTNVYDVTSILDTLDKINDAGIYCYVASSTGDGVYVDHAYLKVTTNLAEYNLNVDVMSSNTGWRTYGTSPYLDAEDYPTNYILNCTPECTSTAEFTFENLSI